MNSGNAYISTSPSFWQIFLLAIAIGAGASYPAAKHADSTWSLDSESYLKMAQGDFEVTSTHRYRLVIPLFSGGIYLLSEKALLWIWPSKSNNPERLLRMCFYLVNLIIFSLAASIIGFQLSLIFGGWWAAVFSLLVVCTSRWTVYMIGVPLTDSLYVLVLSMLWFYGIQGKNLWLVVLLGPLAKETFILFLPLLFLFPTSHHNHLSRVGMVVASVGILFGIRWVVNFTFGPAPQNDWNNITDHISLIGDHLKLLLSFNGVGQLMGTFGLFTLVLGIPLLPFYKIYRPSLTLKLQPYYLVLITFFVSISIHIVLSGDFSRMLFSAFLYLFGWEP